MKLKAALISAILLTVHLTTSCTVTEVTWEDNEFDLNTDINEIISISFEYLEEGKCDMDAVINKRRLEDCGLFLFIEEVPNYESFERLEAEGKFTYTEDFDFDTYYMLIAYGREVVGLEYVSSNFIKRHYGTRYYSLRTTFGEDYYDDTVFIFRVAFCKDRVIIPTRYLSYAYVMEGTEKKEVYLHLANYIEKPLE